MGDQQQFQRRVGIEGADIGVQNLLLRDTRRQLQFYSAGAAGVGQPLHRVLKAGVVNVGIEHRVVRGDLLILPDQIVDGLSGIAGEHDLVFRHAQRCGRARGALAQVGAVPAAGIHRHFLIHLAGGGQIGLFHRRGHLAPVTVLQINDALHARVVRCHFAPEGFVLRKPCSALICRGHRQGRHGGWCIRRGLCATGAGYSGQGAGSEAAQQSAT